MLLTRTFSLALASERIKILRCHFTAFLFRFQRKKDRFALISLDPVFFRIADAFHTQSVIHIGEEHCIIHRYYQ